MMWIDIGVNVLLILRIVLFIPALPQLLDPNDAAWLSEGKMNSKSTSSLVMEK
jgi:hypothetical protein